MHTLVVSFQLKIRLTAPASNVRPWPCLAARGLGLEVYGLGLARSSLRLGPCGLVNATGLLADGLGGSLLTMVTAAAVTPACKMSKPNFVKLRSLLLIIYPITVDILLTKLVVLRFVAAILIYISAAVQHCVVTVS